MKIAIAGKGGAGKTTLSGTLARLIAKEKGSVFAIDADPNANLGSCIGFSFDEIANFVPIIEMKALIEERTGEAPGSIGGYFKLNPNVSDIPDRFKHEYKGVLFLLTGALKEPSSGCYCPENAFLKSLLMNLFIHRNETVILDMEAGFEHLTRGTLEAVDGVIIVIEPGMRSIVTAKKIKNLANKLNIKNIYIVGNKIKTKQDKEFIEKEMKKNRILGYLSQSDEVMSADRNGKAPFDCSPQLISEVIAIHEKLFDSLN